MSTFRLALKSLWHRRAATLLTVVAISLSVALFVGVGKTREATRDAFSGAISRVDLIVGPRTGSLSLLLYSVFHVGAPSHNVSMKAVDYARSLDAVEWIVPFSLGDGYQGFPVVGTTSDFFTKYKVRNGEAVTFSSGKPFAAPDEVVLGSEVATSRRLRLGDLIVLSHGHSEHGDGFERHEDFPFKVVGITSFTGTPVDRSVYVPLEGMGAIHLESAVPAPIANKVNRNQKNESADDHDHDHDHAHDDDHDHGTETATDDAHSDHDHAAHSSFISKDGTILVTQVSGFFVGAKNRMASLDLQRQLNTWPAEALSAILPGVAMSELWKNLAIFETAMSVVSACVVLTGIIGLFVSLLILSGQRRREMVVLRAVGAGPKTIFALLAGEAVFIVLFAIVLGMAFMHLGLYALSPWIEKRFAIHLELSAINLYDMIFAGILLVVGAMVGMLASVRAYRSAMHEGLATKF